MTEYPPTEGIMAERREPEMIIDFGGGIRQQTEGFPKDKANTLIRWVLLQNNEEHLMAVSIEK